MKRDKKPRSKVLTIFTYKISVQNVCKIHTLESCQNNCRIHAALTTVCGIITHNSCPIIEHTMVRSREWLTNTLA